MNPGIDPAGSPSARLRITPWATALFVATSVTAIVATAPVSLADAAQCPGLLEAAAVIAGRTARDLALGSVLISAGILTLFASLLAFAHVVFRATNSVLLTIIIGLAASSSSVFTIALAPAAAPALGLIAVVWLIWPGRSLTMRLGLCVLLALSAGVASSLAVPFAMLGAWLLWSAEPQRPTPVRAAYALLAAALPFAVATVAALLLPQVASTTTAATCAVPSNFSLPSWAGLQAAIGATPLAAAIAAVGLLAVFRARVAPTPWWVWLVPASMWGAVTGGDPERVWAPLALVFWVLVAAGFADVRLALRGTAPRRAAFLALMLAVVALQVLERPRAVIAGDREPLGHAALSRNRLATMVASIPADASLVAEDAVTDLLLRSLPARVRARRQMVLVPRDPDAVIAHVSSGRLYALPRAQRTLQYAGLRLTDIPGTDNLGLAEVRTGGACSSIGATWQSAPSVAGAEHVAVLASNDRSMGPVVLYFSASAPLLPSAAGWETGSSRAFHVRSFSTADRSQRDAFVAEFTEYGSADTGVVPDAAFVVRVELWRVPGSPLFLPVTLGGRAEGAVSRLVSPDSSQRLTLCPWIPHVVTPIGGGA